MRILLAQTGLLLLALLFLGLLVSGCSLVGSDDEAPDVQDEVGTVEPFGKNTTRFVIRPDSDPSIAYLPVEDPPQEFQEAGLRVVFSGDIQPFPHDPAFDARFPLLEVVRIARAE